MELLICLLRIINEFCFFEVLIILRIDIFINLYFFMLVINDL